MKEAQITKGFQVSVIWFMFVQELKRGVEFKKFGWCSVDDMHCSSKGIIPEFER